MCVLLTLFLTAAGTEGPQYLIGDGYAWKRLTGSAYPTSDCQNSSLPACRESTVVGLTNSGDLVVFGGHTVTAFADKWMNDIWLFNFPTKQWSSLFAGNCSAPASTTPRCRSDGGGLVINDVLYIFGGYGKTGGSTDTTVYLADIWSYSLNSHAWVNITPSDGSMPSKVYQATAYDGQDSVYIFGGSTYGITSNALHRYSLSAKKVYPEYYDPVNKCNWTLGAPPCVLFSSMVFHPATNKLYMFSGYVDIQQSLYGTPVPNFLWSWDVASKTWTQLQASGIRRLPGGRLGTSVTYRASDQSMVLVGGMNYILGSDFSSTNDVWFLNIPNVQANPSNQTSWWETVSSATCLSPPDNGNTLPLCLRDYRATQSEDTTILFAGESRFLGLREFTNTLWALRQLPQVAAPSSLVSSPTKGGATIQLQGQSFGLQPQVLVGGRQCTTTTPISCPASPATCLITCTVPPGVGLNVSLTVQTQESVTNWVSLPVAFVNYDPPTVTNVSWIPGSVPTLGSGTNLSVTIRGVNFGTDTSAVSVSVGGTAWHCQVQTTGLTPNEESRILCPVPPGIGSALPVVVCVAGQCSTTTETVSTNALQFAYDAPQISAVYQDSPLPTSGGGEITVIGSNFATWATTQGNANRTNSTNSTFIPLTPAAQQLAVTVGGQTCTPFIAVSATSLVCVAPAGVGGSVHVRVIAGGQMGGPSATAEAKDDSGATAQNKTATRVTAVYRPPVLLEMIPATLYVGESMQVTVKADELGDEINLVNINFNSQGGCSALRWQTTSLDVACVSPPVGEEMTSLAVVVSAGGQGSNPLFINVVYPPLPLGLRIFFAVAAGLVILFELCLMIFLLINRNDLIIKAASPPFCFTVLIGAIMGAFATVFWDPDYRFHGRCEAAIALTVLGFDLMAGALVVKNHRVAKIVNDLRVVGTGHLLRWIALLVIIDLALLMPFLVLNRCPRLMEPSDALAYGIIAGLLFTKTVVLIWGIYLAVKVRNVPHQDFNERHQLGYSMSNLAFCTWVLWPISMASNKNRLVAYALRAAITLWCSLFTVLALFIPKLHLMLIRRYAGRGMEFDRDLMGELAPRPEGAPMRTLSPRGTTTVPEDETNEEATMVTEGKGHHHGMNGNNNNNNNAAVAHWDDHHHGPVRSSSLSGGTK